jgi:cytochrome c peroxidase
MERLAAGIVLTTIGLLSVGGCVPAGRYSTAKSSPRSEKAASKPTGPEQKASPDKSVPAEIAWQQSNPAALAPTVPIVFVHQGHSSAEWDKLAHFWNVVELPPKPVQPAALLAGSPLLAAGLALLPPDRVVKIKVPLGLDDPTPFILPANPPTLAKWELGKRLFFDADNVLPPHPTRGRMACATCHNPAAGYSSPTVLLPRNPPTLINSVYNQHQFWDGRVAALEEVVQRGLEEERDTDRMKPWDRHAWGGIVGRLRKQADYVAQFEKAFGTPPTQDAVSKALATYMRTILAGNSLHDRAEKAMRDRKGTMLEAGDYEMVIDEGALKSLYEGIDKPKDKTEAARELLAGHSLFHGQAGCVRCHAGRQFTNNRFHNIGIGESSDPPVAGQEPGRFAHLPPGLKDPALIGAFRTPTLRALPRSGPYFHDGLRRSLEEAVIIHVKPRVNPFLDPEIRDRGLSNADIHALVRFLRALDGEPVPAIITDPQPGK